MSVIRNGNRARQRLNSPLAGEWRKALTELYRREQSGVDALADELGAVSLEGRAYRFTKGVPSTFGDPSPDETGFFDDVPGLPTRATVGMRRTLTKTRDDPNSPHLGELLKLIKAKRVQWDNTRAMIFLMTTSLLEVDAGGGDIFHEEKISPIALILGNRELALLAGRVLSKLSPLSDMWRALAREKGAEGISETEVAELFKDKLKSEKMAAFARLANQKGTSVYPKMMNDLNLAVQTATRLGVTFAYPPSLTTVEQLADETCRLASVTSVQNARMAAQQKVRGLPAPSLTTGRQPSSLPSVSYGRANLSVGPLPEVEAATAEAPASSSSSAASQPLQETKTVWQNVPEPLREKFLSITPVHGQKIFVTATGEVSAQPTSFTLTRNGQTVIGQGW